MHKFVLSISTTGGSPVCMKCHRPEIDHTDRATCEACNFIGECELHLAGPAQVILLCPSCVLKENEVFNSPERVNERSKFLIAESKARDSSIMLRTDIFNAQTTSIIDLKNAIDSDSNIVNKNFELARLLTDRMNSFKRAVFELNEQMVDKVSEQRAIQTYLNDLANRLRVKEREEIKLADVSYQPNPAKVSKPRHSISAHKKYDKIEIRKSTIELNSWAIANGYTAIPESVLQMVCIAKNMTPAQAAEQLKAGMTTITKV